MSSSRSTRRSERGVGVKLIVEMLDGAPSSLGPSQRLVLLVLAESANDWTRECWPGMDVLTRRTGLTSPSVRRVLADLVAAEVVERVAVGKDRTGAPVYAHRGHATVYRIACVGSPDRPLKALTSEPQTGPLKVLTDERLTEGKGLAGERHTRQKGAHLRAERRSSPSERRLQASPLPSVPSENPQISARDTDECTAVIGALRARTGKTIGEDHAQRVVDQILDGRTVRNRRAYLAGAIERDADPHRFLPTPTPPPFRGLWKAE